MNKHLIESTVIINAPIDQVWKTLTSFDYYSEWNPFTPKVEIKPVIGSTVGLHVRLNPNSQKTMFQKETLLVWDEENKRLEWGIQNAWYVRTIRLQQLTDLGNNKTRYYTSDFFEGPLTKLILWLYRSKIQIGFDDVCNGLKQHLENPKVII